MDAAASLLRTNYLLMRVDYLRTRHPMGVKSCGNCGCSWYDGGTLLVRHSRHHALSTFCAFAFVKGGEATDASID